MNKRQTGSSRESEAASYLTGMGYQILERNYRCRQGEIDLVAKDGPYLVFVEVKYRRSVQAGWPEEAVGLKKQQKIYQAARHYLFSQHLKEDTPCRFDVVSITGENVRVIKDAFS